MAADGDDAMVPEQIMSGGTRYTHSSDGTSDLYAAEGHEGDKDFTWKYCVAKNQNNTVYFSNRRTSQSVWVLPDLHAADGAPDPVMTTSGLVPRTRKGSAPKATSSAGAADRSEGTASNVAAARDASRERSGSTGSAAQPRTADDIRSDIERRVREQIAQRQGASAAGKDSPKGYKAHAPRTLSGVGAANPDDVALSPMTSAPDDMSPRREIPSDGDDDHNGAAGDISARELKFGEPSASAARKARSEARPGGKAARSESPASGTPALDSSTGTGKMSARERLALYRQRKAGGSVTPRSVSTPVEVDSQGGSPHGAGREWSTAGDAEVASIASRGGARSATTSDAPVVRPTPSRTAAAQPTSTPVVVDAVSEAHSAPTSTNTNEIAAAILAERRQQSVLEDEQLQREREALLLAERMALERRSRVLQTQREEEEALSRAIAARRDLEAARMQQAARSTSPAARPAGDVVGDLLPAAAERLEAERRRFVESQAAEQHRADVGRARALSYSDAIAAALLESVRQRQAAVQAEERLRAARLEEERLLAERQRADEARRVEDAYLGTGGKAGGDGKRHPSKGEGASSRLLGGGPHCVPYGPQMRFVGGLLVTPQEHAARVQALTERAVKGVAGRLVDGAAMAGRHYHKEGRGVYYYNVKGDRLDDATIARLAAGGTEADADTEPPVAPQATTYYSGSWRADMPDGTGTLSAPRAAYHGGFAAGQMAGQGTLQTRRLYGSMDMQNGKAHGAAVVETSAGEVFSGTMAGDAVGPVGSLSLAPPPSRPAANAHEAAPPSLADAMEWVWSSPSTPGTGRARIAYSNGDSFVGDVVDFRPAGDGCYRFKAGHVYTGTFHEGSITGHGTFKFSSGNIYAGDVRKGCFDGHGTYTRLDAFIYDGAWSQGQMHGQARVTFSNGDVWEGVFVRDVRGNGKYVQSAQFLLAPTP